jgi:hypothetical protein
MFHTKLLILTIILLVAVFLIVKYRKTGKDK